MSALKSDLKQAKEVPFFLNQLCLILPEEIEKFTKRKIKERVSAFKAVSGLDMPLDLIRKEKSLEENLDLENQAANESSSDESKAKILPFKRLGENLQDISATEPTKKVIEPDRDYELERLENELKATTEETSGALSTLGINLPNSVLSSLFSFIVSKL